MLDYSWKKTDPRISINKRANIVILRPSLTGFTMEASTGEVETKNAYCVFTNFENHPLVGEDEKWDEAWLWTWAPKIENE